jgi:transcriptional regulator with XRE-family HTH domain
MHVHASQFARRFRFARERAGLSQAEIARSLMLSPSTVWRWQDGRSVPRPAERGRLADLLGVNRDWLMSGRGAPPPDETLEESGSAAA